MEFNVKSYNTSSGTLKQIEIFLKSLPFHLGWKWKGIAYRPTGAIRISLKNEMTKRTVNIELSGKDESTPCYSTTRSFNVGIVKEKGLDSLDEEEEGITRYIVHFLKNFDKGGLELPRTKEGLGSKVKEYEEINDVSGTSSSVKIQLSTDCDWKCCFCPGGVATSKAKIPKEEKLAEELDERFREWEKKNVTDLTITGDEPLNHSAFIDILNRCTSYFNSVVVQTTGLKLLDECFADRINELNKVIFEVPLYGADANIHDAITGVDGSHSKVMAVAKEISLNVNVHTIIMKKNKGGMKKIREVCERHGRRHKLIILYISTDEELYVRNAVALSDIVAEVKNAFSADEYSDFISLNCKKIPPCVSGTMIKAEEKRGGYKSICGKELPAPLWDEKNPSLINCKHKKRCSYEDICPGIFSTYVKEFGWNEFKPV